MRLLRFRTQGGNPAELASELIAAGRHAEALEVATAGMRSAPSDLSLLVLAARARIAMRDLLSAEALLLKVVRASPDHVEALRWLGESLVIRGDFARALKVLGRGATIAPKDEVIAALIERAKAGGKSPEPP